MKLQHKFRASSIGEIMTDPKGKDEVLSVGAKTYLEKLAKQFVYGYDEVISGKYMDKGIQVEDQTIELINRVFFTNYKKNTERRINEWVTGECDILVPGVKIIDGPENRIVFIGMDQFRDELPGSSVKGKNPFKDKRVREALNLAVDREAIKRALAGAAGVQLEGRFVPIVRSRAEGISRCASLGDKVRAWAGVTGARVEPLLEYLERLSHQTPEQIAAEVLRRRPPAEAPDPLSLAASRDPGAKEPESVSGSAPAELELF